MSYRTILPNIFPFSFAAPIPMVQQYVTELLQERTDVPQGSSFAVTTDNHDGTWNIWLSMVSMKYLEDLHPELRSIGA